MINVLVFRIPFHVCRYKGNMFPKSCFYVDRAVTLSDSQGSSPSHVVIPGLNIENTDDEDRASSSTDL